jgi:hypothetical protein
LFTVAARILLLVLRAESIATFVSELCGCATDSSTRDSRASSSSQRQVLPTLWDFRIMELFFCCLGNRTRHSPAAGLLIAENSTDGAPQKDTSSPRPLSTAEKSVIYKLALCVVSCWEFRQFSCKSPIRATSAYTRAWYPIVAILSNRVKILEYRHFDLNLPFLPLARVTCHLVGETGEVMRIIMHVRGFVGAPISVFGKAPPLSAAPVFPARLTQLHSSLPPPLVSSLRIAVTCPGKVGSQLAVNPVHQLPRLRIVNHCQQFVVNYQTRGSSQHVYLRD